MNSQIDIAEEQNVGSSEGSGLAFAVGFFFSLRISIVLFCVRILGMEPSTGSEISLALNLFLLGLVCFDSLGFGRRTFGSILQLPSVRWVLTFLIFSCCSLAWSEAASVPNSAAYWGGMFTDVAIVVLLLRGRSVTEASHSLMKGFIWSTCCLALVAWIMPVQSDLRLGDEDFFNTNQIGNLCAFAILLAQYLMRRKEGKWGLAIFFLAITLFRSLSKTTLVAFLVSEGFLMIQDRSIRRETKILLMIALTLLIFVFWGLFEAYYDIYTTAGNQAETLTGRTAIWLYVLNAVSDHPWNLWIGHGFDSMWHVIPLFAGGQFEARHAENELLQQLYAYGIAGIVMLGLIYGSLYRQIRRLPRSPLKIVFFSIVLFVVVRGIAEADPFDLLLPLWAIVLFSMLVDNAKMTEHEMSPISPSA